MELQRIAAIDDQPRSIEIMSDSITNFLDAEPVCYKAIAADQYKIEQWVKDEDIDGVLIDYNLKKGNFSTQNGAVIAAHLFRMGKPTVLTTAGRLSGVAEAIWLGREIPAFVDKKQLDLIGPAFNRAQQEIQGKIKPERRAYRTVVRIENADSRHCNLVILAYDPHEIITVTTADLRHRLGSEPIEGMRFKAEVNIGAESVDELFISEISL